MLRVGLTGGVASGKTTVGKMMEERGAYLIQADIIAHELMSPGEAVYTEIVKRFGQSIVNENDGKIDRAILGALAFGEGRINELNNTVHPAVIQRQEEWMTEIGRKDPDAIAVVEAALIIEAGVQLRFDKLLVVTTTEEEKLRRFIERARMRGMDAATATERFACVQAAQLPDGEKMKVADFIVDNSGTQDETRAKVEKVMEELQALAAAK